jgi:hypothetical protein
MLMHRSTVWKSFRTFSPASCQTINRSSCLSACEDSRNKGTVARKVLARGQKGVVARMLPSRPVPRADWSAVCPTRRFPNLLYASP